MTFAIDFDDTFTADPALFTAFITFAKARGHRCVCVTARADRVMYTDPSRHCGDEVRAALNGLMPIVFSGGDPKEVAAAMAGYAIDVWIDDNPAAIVK